MGSCCSKNSKELSHKTLPKSNSKTPATDTENTQVVTTSSFRYRCISPRSRKKVRVSLQSITNNYLVLSKKSKIVSEAINHQLQLLKLKLKEPELKMKDYSVISPEDYMICKVCNDILLKPKLCSKCSLFICSHCFENTTMMCNHSFVKELNEYYSNIIEILSTEEFKCFNWKNGCGYLSNYSKITFNKKRNLYSTKHDQQCIHQIEKCNNPNCTYQGLVQDYIAHLRKCPHSAFYCFYCKERFTKTEKEFHNCFNSKPMAFSLPIRYCECGTILDWIVRSKEDDDTGRSKCYYRCSHCDEEKKERKYPPPIAKVCGCFSKLKGGFIYRCISCSADGGIGWSCNLCGNNISICEVCLVDTLEISLN